MDVLTGYALRSLVTAGGALRLSLDKVVIPEPRPDEVVIQVAATPLNPSDLRLLFAAADMAAAIADESGETPVVTATVPPERMRANMSRAGQSMPVGNEGAGIVVRAGAEVRSMLGKLVGAFGGGMYAQYAVVKAASCLVLPDDAAAADGASLFVNPMAALGMVETMRMEGHRALVFTAAASNLGQMLNKICMADGIELVNIVRSETQAAMLKDIGARHVCDSHAANFREALTDALYATGATLAFDAIGGGDIAATILSCMEAALSRDATAYSNYGSHTHKQVYIYGNLDPSPATLARTFGMAWGIGGWLMTTALDKAGPDRKLAVRERIQAEYNSTFASKYTAELSLAEVLRLDNIAAYRKQATGEKYLINPSKSFGG